MLKKMRACKFEQVWGQLYQDLALNLLMDLMFNLSHEVQIEQNGSPGQPS